MDRISVIVPAYNVESYLKRCINSILNQSINNYEIVLVDDGSFERTALICDELCIIDERIVVIHQENQGLSSARNIGVEYCLNCSDSEWINFVDSDDWVIKDYLKILIDLCVKNNLDISFGGFYRVSEYSENETSPCCSVGSGQIINTESIYSYNFDFANSIASTAKLYRKCLLCDVHFPIGKHYEDLFTTYKILFKTSKVVVADAPIYAWFIRENSITCNKEWTAKKLDTIYAYEEQISFFMNIIFASLICFQLTHIFVN